MRSFWVPRFQTSKLKNWLMSTQKTSSNKWRGEEALTEKPYLYLLIPGVENSSTTQAHTGSVAANGNRCEGDLMVLAFWLCFLPCNLPLSEQGTIVLILILCIWRYPKSRKIYCTTKLDALTEVLGETRGLQGNGIKSLKTFFVYIKQLHSG